MATKKVSISEMADAINKGLQEYANLATEDMKAAVKKTATSVKKEISANAPVDTGAYAKSWTTKTTVESSQSLQVTVYSKNRYQLAHLLEKGHANRNGVRTKAYPHIAPAEENGKVMLEQLVESALKG
ncbi:MAG: HK97 gp10 family phage protein [Oscillospiraceae bacterium]|nr:HK97 gp10 family phage protein [Oscillospiraceae bacterium]